MTEFFIPPFPTGLTRSPDPARDRQQGDEPHHAASWGVRLSAEWRLYADGREVPVYSTPVTRGGPHSFAKLRLAQPGLAQPGLVQPDGTVRFRAVRDSAKPIGSVSVLPSSLGCTPLFEGHEVFFTVSGTGSITLLTDGMDDCPLTILLLPPRERTPRGSLYYGPGLHTLNWLDLNDGDTLVVDDGAVVTALPPDESPIRASDWAGMPNYRDFIAADHKKNVSVRGGGILDFSLLEWHARNPILFRDCENVTIEDVTLVNAPAWNLDFMGCRGVRADSVSIFGYRENSDGIDIVSSEEVTVTNCFIRTGDDAVAVKAMLPPPRCGGRAIRVSRCAVWNDKVRCFGIAAESRNDITDVRFEDCDVLRSYADWTTELGSLVVYICDRGRVSDITFENIRIEHEVHLAANVLITRDKWSSDSEAGSIRGVVFRNIDVKPKVGSRVAGYDAGHTAENIRFENFRVEGKTARSAEEAGIEICPFTSDVCVRAEYEKAL